MTLSLLLAAAALAAPPAPAVPDDAAAIRTTIDRFLKALEGEGSPVFAEILSPDGPIARYDLRKGESRRPNRLGAITARPPTRDAAIIERIGPPTIQVSGPMASVWAPYALWEKGSKSHCGIDHFLLSKDDGKWVIVGLYYTMEPVARCAALGAPDRP